MFFNYRNALTPGVDALHDWAHMSRVFPQGVYRLGTPYKTWERFVFIYFSEHSFSSDLNPIVARLGNDKLGGTWGPEWYTEVIALNQDAVTVLGTGVVRLNLPSLAPLSSEDLLHRAEMAAPVEEARPAP